MLFPLYSAPGSIIPRTNTATAVRTRTTHHRASVGCIPANPFTEYSLIMRRIGRILLTRQQRRPDTESGQHPALATPDVSTRQTQGSDGGDGRGHSVCYRRRLPGARRQRATIDHCRDEMGAGWLSFRHKDSCFPLARAPVSCPSCRRAFETSPIPVTPASL